MSNTNLSTHFESTKSVNIALHHYDEFAATARGWDVGHKLELYGLAMQARDKDLDDTAQIEAFERLIDNLKRYWQIARGGAFAPVEMIRDWLTPLATELSMTSDLDRETIASGHHDDLLLSAITPLRHIKQTRSDWGWGSPMAISKVLHFFNPRVFPIYDHAVVDEIVLKQFRSDWRSYEPMITVGNQPLHLGVLFYLKYVRWCAEIMTEAHPDTMAVFKDWVLSHQDARDFAMADQLPTFDAVAFEMIAIGAAHQV